MFYEFLIARRYLRARRQIALVSVISTIAAIGVAIGVAALICTLAVFNGFGSVVTNMLVGFDPHVRVEGMNGQPLHNSASIEKIIQSTPDVIAAAPVVSGRLMIVNHNLMQVATARGVTGAIGDVSGVARSMVVGKFELDRGEDLQGIVLGVRLADRLHTTLGDTVTLISPVGIDAAYTQFAQPLSKRFRIAGMYSSMNKEYDANFAYINISAAQKLFDRQSDEVEAIDIRCASIAQSDAVKAALQKALAGVGEKTRVETWYDLHKDLYSVMETERWIAYLLLCLIIAVAAFTILGSLTMTVIEKQRDISLLKAVGATDRSVGKIFLFAGTCIGIIGTIAGTILGYIVCWAQIHFQIFKLSSQFVIPAVPVEMRAMDFIVVGISAIVLCTVAALYPARRAARVAPAEGLRWE